MNILWLLIYFIPGIMLVHDYSDKLEGLSAFRSFCFILVAFLFSPVLLLSNILIVLLGVICGGENWYDDD